MFLIYYVLNGLINEKEYDLYIGFTTTFLIIISLSTYEFGYHYANQNNNPPLIQFFRLLICFSALPISIYLVVKIADEISWTEFKIVGASELFQCKNYHLFQYTTRHTYRKKQFSFGKKDIYRQSGFFVSLLKVDFQLALCVLLLEFRQGPHYVSHLSTTLVLVLLPVTLIIAIVGYKAVIFTFSAKLFMCKGNLKFLSIFYVNSL